MKTVLVVLAVVMLAGCEFNVAGSGGSGNNAPPVGGGGGLLGSGSVCTDNGQCASGECINGNDGIGRCE